MDQLKSERGFTRPFNPVRAFMFVAPSEILNQQEYIQYFKIKFINANCKSNFCKFKVTIIAY
jgi:hypothetical protein